VTTRQRHPLDTMTTDDETAKAAEAGYRRLRGDCDEMRIKLDDLGRTDVPLDDPRHINNADDTSRKAWFDQYKILVLKEIEREDAMNQVAVCPTPPSGREPQDHSLTMSGRTAPTHEAEAVGGQVGMAGHC